VLSVDMQAVDSLVHPSRLYGGLKVMPMPELSSPRILIVDDEPEQMRALCNALRDHGYQTVGFTDGPAALEDLRIARCELLLADLTMPRMNGIALLEAARAIDPDLVGIIMTGQDSIATAVEAMPVGALDFIVKPFQLTVILPVLSRALMVRRLRCDNAELQRSAREHSVELEATIKELEAFTYSVSHDLRAPLTVVIGYTDVLIEDYAARMPVEAQKILGALMAGGERMMQLIDDLLRLSRLGRRPLFKRPVSVSALVRDVLDGLQQQEERQVDVRVGELPDCVGDQALLRQVLANLLSNAFKFTRGREKPIVELSCRQQAGEKVYSVRDNGAGFDMHHAQDLFVAFQRFHSAERFEGTGIGLSIANRIVQRHGGRIWAEAELDKGATFYFSLPE
jgi:signal transduction histidine kinase